MPHFKLSPKFLAFVALAVVASACQSVPSVPYNKAGNVGVKTIGIAAPGMPEDASVQILASAGANFGLVGALVEAGRAESAQNEMKDILAKAGYDFKADLKNSLVDSLILVGFNSKPSTDARPAAENTKFLKKCVPPANADACLDVYVNYLGYMAAGPKTDYIPTVHITAKLTRASDGAVLFQDQIQHNTSYPNSKAIVVQPSGNFRFADRPALQADPNRVAAGLKEAVHKVIDELAKQFK